MIYIVGKNSNLFQAYKSFLENKYPYHSEQLLIFSHNEITNLRANKNDSRCVLFSLSRDPKENEYIIDELIEKFADIRIIGSSSILSDVSDFFEYSSLKKKQFEYSQALNRKGHNIVNHLFGDFKQSNRTGLKALSIFQDLHDYIFDDNRLSFSTNKFHYDGTNKRYPLKTYKKFEEILGVKITALMFKLFTNFTYGYSRINNQKV